MQSGICSKVKFHGKRLPWFVSDVTKKDWDWRACYTFLYPKHEERD